MARQERPTLASVEVARDAVAKAKKRPAQKRALTMVYLLEVRVPVENASDFRTEHIEDSLIQYGSCDVIDEGVVEGDV